MLYIYLFSFFISIHANESYEIRDNTLKIHSDIQDDQLMIYPWSNEKQQFYTVVLNETVKNIPIGAFSGFINLKFFSFSSSLEKINDYVFYNTGLTELYLNDSRIISLGSNSFSNNKFLRNIVLPKELKQIGNRSFSKCKNLK